MAKDFDGWNRKKQALDRISPNLHFHERELWWCSIGVNVGSEQHSLSADFSRPVVIVRCFTPEIFWAVPLTTKTRDDVPFRVRLSIHGISNDALLLQLRAYDRRRLRRKLGTLSREDFDRIVSALREVVQPAVSSRIKNDPRLREGLGGRSHC